MMKHDPHNSLIVYFMSVPEEFQYNKPRTNNLERHIFFELSKKQEKNNVITVTTHL